MKVYFSDFFEIDEKTIEEYGAFNPSLINDLPLFIDPFLLYTNDDEELRNLHNEVISYVAFLKEQAAEGHIRKRDLEAWFMFPEVKQNWFGYSEVGNGGSGLGNDFASSLNDNLHTIFPNFGEESVTKESHLEKLCLIKDGVGKDNISDFTTNLIKQYLLEYTEKFAKENINQKYLEVHYVKKSYFDYNRKTWMPQEFTLPTYKNDFVLLTPKSILTKDNTWINKQDLYSKFDGIVNALPNELLRDRMNAYLFSCLPEDYKKAEYNQAVRDTVSKYPEYIDYFIKSKEENYREAKSNSSIKVSNIEKLFIRNLKSIYHHLETTEFYDMSNDNQEDLYMKAQLFKNVIESKDGYKHVYIDDKPITRETELRLLIKLVFLANIKSKSQQKLSKQLSFKLASNNVLKDTIAKKIKREDNLPESEKDIFAIICYSDREYGRMATIFKDLKISESKTLFTIDARESV